MVDEKRIEELSAKRQESGLSDDEADELGKLFAEQEGKPYSNAKTSKLPPGQRGEDVPAAGTSGSDVAAGTESKLGEPPRPRPTDVAPEEQDAPPA